MIQYKLLKKDAESFEYFHDRVLANYSRAYIGFYLQFKAYIKKNNIELDLNINDIEQTGKNEAYELFSFGRKIYYKLTKVSAFKEYDGYSNKYADEKITNASKLVENIDKNLDSIISKILNTKDKRAVVFSEVLEELSLV
jgi:hypothetical protein